MEIYRITRNKTAGAPENPDQAPVNVTWIDVVSCHAGTDAGLKIDRGFMKFKYNIGISEEEIFIFLSHRRAWEIFLKSGDEYCLIMEDNVSMTAQIPEIKEKLKQLPEEWDLYMPFDKLKENKPADQPYFLGFYWGACVYFLSREGARKLTGIAAIRQPLDDEILSMTHDNLLNTYYEESKDFDIRFDDSAVHVGRREEIEKTIGAYNAWTIDQKHLIREILERITAIARDLDIPLILHGGSLLGCVQHGQIIPWDDDVDIGLDEDYFPLFWKALMADGKLSCASKVEEKSGILFYKVWSDAGEVISGHSYKFPFVDIWLYKRDHQDIVFHNGIIFPNAAGAGLEEVVFENSRLYIAKNYMECLDSMYEHWRTKFIIYPWSHRLEKVYWRSFETGIYTDEKGKFLSYQII